jgi:hypothetical protein
MVAADHSLVVSQANGDVWTDHIPGHGRSVPLSCCAPRAPAQSTEMSNLLIGWQHLAIGPRPFTHPVRAVGWRLPRDDAADIYEFLDRRAEG